MPAAKKRKAKKAPKASAKAAKAAVPSDAPAPLKVAAARKTTGDPDT